MILWYISILGIPVGSIYLLKWVCRHISLSTGTKVSFTGVASQIYGLFVLNIILSALKWYDPSASEAFDQTDSLIPFVVAVLWSFALIAGQALVIRELTKWVFASLSFSSGVRLIFRGRRWPYIWWYILSALSLFTVIGWGWVGAAFYRWQFKNTDAGRYHLVFRGSGFDLLWRGLVGFAGMLFILPIPWIFAWLHRWFAENVDAKLSA